MDVVTLTQKLVRIESLSGKEQNMALAVEEAMRALGYRDVERDRFGNIVGKVGPRGNQAALLFDGHMDVVPPVGDWTVDPYSGVIKGSRLYGRGVTDMKAGLAAAICGVAEAGKSGKLSNEVVVSASVYEEIMEGVALAAVLDRVQPEMVVICEPSELIVKVGQRGRLELLLSVQGRPAHAAHAARGINPIHLAVRGLALLNDIEMQHVEGFGRGQLVATDIVTDPYPSVCMIPNKAVVRFDGRTVPGETAESISQRIMAVLTQVDNSAFSVEIGDDPIRMYTGLEMRAPRELPAWKGRNDHPLSIAAADSLEACGINTQFGICAACTNGSESAGRRGIPTIVLGPGNPSDAHTIDESIEIEQIRAAAIVYRTLALRLAGRG